jgi:predicted RNA-binding Zn ribbon-like protein
VSGRAHPRDSAGLVLPDGSWPDGPGVAGALEPVRRFCNTTNRENGADAWRSTEELDRWLAREGYRLRPTRPADLRRLVTVRGATWQSIRTGSLEPIAAVAGTVTFGVAVVDGRIELVPADDSVEGVVAGLVLRIHDAERAGTFSRLRSCAHCRWVFFDTSRNRTGRWCSMQACGGREKAKAYRRRRARGEDHPASSRAGHGTGVR